MRGAARELLAEAWAYFRQTRKLSVFILLLVLLAIGGLVLLTEGSAVLPFIYTLF